MKSKFIESPFNPTLKWIKKVCSNPKKEGFVVFEGEHLLEEALKSDFQFQKVVVTEEKYEKWKERILLFETIIIKQPIFNKISVTKSSEGIMVIGNFKKSVLKDAEKNSSYIYLDGVQDPVNVGILIRSAYAFNFDAVFLGEGSANQFNPTVIGRSAGAIFHIPIFDLKKVEFLIWAEINKVAIYIGDASGEKFSSNYELKTPYALVLGNEARGASDEMFSKKEKIFSIPMRQGWDSLNVATAGSILMYEIKKGKM